jgi:hypothetical protein
MRKKITKNLPTIAAVLLIAAFMTGRASGSEIRSDFDRDPDLLVNFNAFLRDKTKVTTRPAPVSYGGYYGYRRGHYDPWFGYSHSYATETHISEYTEGTLNIDLVDAKRKNLVWEAAAVGRVREETLRNLEQAVMEAVPRFFATYPHRAGEAAQIYSQQ